MDTDTDAPSLTSSELSEFLNEFFALNANTGVVYLNMNAYTDREFHNRLRALATNKFVVMRVRVLDNGLVALHNLYHIKLLLCFNEPTAEMKRSSSMNSRNSTKYCRFSSQSGKMRPVFVRSLESDSADEEANLNDISDEAEVEPEAITTTTTPAGGESYEASEDIYADLLSRSGGTGGKYDNFDFNHRLNSANNNPESSGGSAAETTRKPASDERPVVPSGALDNGFLFSSSSSSSSSSLPVSFLHSSSSTLLLLLLISHTFFCRY
jgi:hypothetical protein